MENQGEHKRDKATLFFWTFIGLGMGIVIGASTHKWALSLVGGLLIGLGMAFAATKKGLD